MLHQLTTTTTNSNHHSASGSKSRANNRRGIQLQDLDFNQMETVPEVQDETNFVETTKNYDATYGDQD